MPREANRRAQPASAEVGWLVAMLFLLGALGLGGLFWLAALTNPQVHARARTDPLTVFGAMMDGRVTWTSTQLILTVSGILLLLTFAAFIGWAFWSLQRRATRVDYKARYLAQERDLRSMELPAIEEDAQRLLADRAGPGLPLGKSMAGKHLYASWEWVMIAIMGPRAGKTSCLCVPQLIETGGPVLGTSNKRDIVDLTRGPRSEKGVVYVHDVQGIIGEPATWWWNPLSFVKDMETAEKLASMFQSSAESADAKQDAYFSTEARMTLTRLLLAAALAHRPVTDVFRWAGNPDDADNPARILIDAGEGAQGRALGVTQSLTAKQRDGVYGTIRPWIGVLGNRRVLPWITDPGMTRAHFSPEAFVTSTNTVYLISSEGGGSARAITGALTMAILEAAERIGSTSLGGRLPTPLVAVLDEAANVCRWRELPDKYSHYGSRGIILATYFQSYQQGVEAFGETGMAKLWSASNVRLVGSGLSDADSKFLQAASVSIGDFDAMKRSRSTQRNGSSTSTSLQRERIFDVADLTAMPKGRAVMLATQTPAALIRLEHFSARPYAEKITESKDYYEKAAVDRAAQLGGQRHV